MQGIINIIGYIGSFPGPDGIEIKGIELIDVVAQVQAQGECESYLTNINSKGGVCKVGYEIYDYLKTLGKPIYTEATGYCCSMATIVMMAGVTREGVEPLEFLPHNPWTSGVGGDADEIQAVAEEMRVEEDKMIAFYSEATGISSTGIDAIMKLNKPIPLDKAVELKFLTSIKQPLKAVAVIKKNKDMSLAIIDHLNKKFDLLMKAVKPAKAQATVFTTTDSKDLEILNQDQTDITGDPVVGNLVMINGAPAPDGTYTFPDYSIDVLLGVVTAVNPTAAAAAAKKKEDDDKAEKERLAALTKSADEVLKKENEDLKKENTELKEFSEKLGVKIEGLEKAVTLIKSNYKAPDEQTVFAMKTKADVADIKVQAMKARDRYKGNAKK